jgi:hypothetical protein
MKPGERIPMIAEAAKDLLTRPWAEAQLILDQFGFHTYESEYNIDEHSYFIQQIKDGEDGQVAGLYGYLRGEKKFRPTQLTRRGRVSRFVCFCHTSIRSGYLLAT